MSHPTDRDIIVKGLCEIIEGKQLPADGRVEIAIKGAVLGFPATLEAIKTQFPFGVTYFIETDILHQAKSKTDSTLNLTIAPRITKGWLQTLGRLLLFDNKGKEINNKRFDQAFIAISDDMAKAQRLILYPGMMDRLERLHEYTGFTELHVRIPQGVVMQQPTAFDDLDLDVCREAFKLLSELAQVVFEAF